MRIEEPVFLSSEQLKINERFDLLVSLVNDSKIGERTKNAIKERLLIFRNGAFNEWESFRLAIYYTISSILSIVEKDKNNEETMALFENIRDDLWALYREMT
jgi:hypothetical protein